MIAAIVLAAGKSERMGRPKALLEFQGQTFLQRILGAIRAGGIEHSVVVAGHHYREIAASLVTAPVFNPDYERGMSTSVQAGVRVLPSNVTGAGVFLVDHPLIDPATITQLAAALTPGRIVIPVCAGRRGHPVFLAAELFGEVLALGSDQGLNVVVRRDLLRVQEVSVENPGVLVDVDTPQEFEKLLRQQP